MPEGGVCSPECTLLKQGMEALGWVKVGWLAWPVSTLQKQGGLATPCKEKGHISVSPRARIQSGFTLVGMNLEGL
jgi:hypothetical protein